MEQYLGKITYQKETVNVFSCNPTMQNGENGHSTSVNFIAVYPHKNERRETDVNDFLWTDVGCRS